MTLKRKLCLAFFVSFVAALMITIGDKIWTTKAWPAETEENHVAIMEQAKNWPVKGEDWVVGTLGKFHQDPQNPDRAMLAIWFPNKDNNYQMENFAKILFLWSAQKPGEFNNSLAAVLKKEDGNWMFGSYLRKTEVLYNGEKAIAFRLFRNDDREVVYIRIFLLKDLVLPKK